MEEGRMKNKEKKGYIKVSCTDADSALQVKNLADELQMIFYYERPNSLPSGNQFEGSSIDGPREDVAPRPVFSYDQYVEGNPKTLTDMEKEAISHAIDYYRGNLTMVAKKMGIGRATLYRKIKEYEIDYSDYRVSYKQKKAA